MPFTNGARQCIDIARKRRALKAKPLIPIEGLSCYKRHREACGLLPGVRV
jgi:hypothetical protein